MPQTNPFVVIFGFLGAISLLQYFSRKSMYRDARRHVETMPTFKLKIQEAV